MPLSTDGVARRNLASGGSRSARRILRHPVRHEVRVRLERERCAPKASGAREELLEEQTRARRRRASCRRSASASGGDIGPQPYYDEARGAEGQAAQQAGAPASRLDDDSTDYNVTDARNADARAVEQRGSVDADARPSARARSGRTGAENIHRHRTPRARAARVGGRTRREDSPPTRRRRARRRTKPPGGAGRRSAAVQAHAARRHPLVSRRAGRRRRSTRGAPRVVHTKHDRDAAVRVVASLAWLRAQHAAMARAPAAR